MSASQFKTAQAGSSLAIAGASVRAAAFSAQRAGFYPIAADLFADDDLCRFATTTRVRPYPEGLLDWLRATQPPAWMYTGALENHPALIDAMAWVSPLWGNPTDVLLRVRSPWELFRELVSAGVQCPEIRTLHDPPSANGSWLAKTYRGASGSGVREFRGDLSSLRTSVADSSFCFQRRISGLACAAVYIGSDRQAQLLGVTRQLVGASWLGCSAFKYAGSIGPQPVDDEAQSQLMRIGNVLADQFELLGLFGVDFILNSDGVWPLEVNPRYTASVEIIERMNGILAVALHALACTGTMSNDPANPSSKVTTPAHGKAILFAKHRVTISDRCASSALEDAMIRPWPTNADIPASGTTLEVGQPVLTMFAEGMSVSEVEQRLRERAAELENELYHGLR